MGFKELTPVHAGVVEKTLLASRKEHVAERSWLRGLSTAQQQPRVSRNHVCHKADHLLIPVLPLPASAECCELHWAQVGKPTSFPSTHFHMARSSFISFSKCDS